MKHGNLAIFIPHAGCPHRCSFCDQRQISGRQEVPAPEKIKETMERCVNRPGHRADSTQIAFFGGSFTCIPRGQMIAYLETAKAYIDAGHFSGIRISTRPDGISDEILSLLQQYDVRAIELGAQSMDADILRRSNRGHTPEDTVAAARKITEAGIELGLQMLLGLPGDTKEKAMESAQKMAALHPAEMRLYPAVVFPGTDLYQQYLRREYQPLTLEDALDWTVPIACFLEESKIRLLKIGLHQANGAVAGAFHPAFGEMVRTGMWNRHLKEHLPPPPAALTIPVHPSELSIALGQKKKNLQFWAEEGYRLQFIADPKSHRLLSR